MKIKRLAAWISAIVVMAMNAEDGNAVQRYRVPVPSLAGSTSVIAPRATGDTFHFTGVTLTDGDETYEQGEIYVRVKESRSGGYSRADYMDRDGRRLGFYEAFEVVSTDESALRAWAIRNFHDRTTG